ncbi:MAG: PAS domain S-box protein [Gemmatimonadales bacterium]|nr:PAS domain S-box protein [Gemmatimonadales bacterium]
MAPQIWSQDRLRNGHLKALSEALPAAILWTDPMGNLVYVNERWCALAGLRRDQAIGEGWTRALHPEDRDQVLQQWKKSISEGRGCQIEFRLRAPDGTVRVVACEALPLSEESGVVSGYVAVTWDVTTRQRKEIAVHEMAQQLQERVKELNCLYGISHIVERGGSLDTILQETANLLPPSWEHSDVACARIVLDGHEFKTDNFRETPWRQVADLRVHGERTGTVEVCYLDERPKRDDGPFLEGERALIDAVAARLGHVAERLRAEELHRQREEELRARLTHLTRVGVMGEMASSIAHEVNQPLTAIATYAQAIRRLVEAAMMDSPEVLDALTRIREEALRAGGIIHRLRDLVRKRESERTECDVNNLIREVEHLASVDARLHDVRLCLKLSADVPVVLADGIQIQQVVLNLVRNAIDAMAESEAQPREAIIRTRTWDDGDVEVSVSDNGCGLPENADDRLFQAFFTTKKGGMGMGLSISRTIVNSHGGRMWFSRNPQGGSTFSFTLPAL